MEELLQPLLQELHAAILHGFSKCPIEELAVNTGAGGDPVTSYGPQVLLFLSLQTPRSSQKWKMLEF